jgi:hypothetical protein
MADFNFSVVSILGLHDEMRNTYKKNNNSGTLGDGDFYPVLPKI